MMDRFEKLKLRAPKVKTVAHAEKIIRSFGKDADKARALFGPLMESTLIPSSAIPASQATRAHIPPGTKLDIKVKRYARNS